MRAKYVSYRVNHAWGGATVYGSHWWYKLKAAPPGGVWQGMTARCYNYARPGWNPHNARVECWMSFGAS